MARVAGAQASRARPGTSSPEASQGALRRKQNPGLAEPWGNPIVAFSPFLHCLCFDNEMIVWILQEVIISVGTEPVLVQRPYAPEPRLLRSQLSHLFKRTSDKPQCRQGAAVCRVAYVK